MCPVAGVPLVDLAIERVAAVTGGGTGRLAVNAHALADQVQRHCAGRAHVSVESPQALGTAGALGALRDWLDGRPVLLTNADSYLPAGLGSLADGWDGVRSRLLCLAVDGPGDFPGVRPGLRYVGAALLPADAVRRLRAEPSGLYEVLWRDQAERGELDLVPLAEAGAGHVAVDCGTPADYLRANLHASGGTSVVGAGARVEGTVERSVVWDGAAVAPGEHLVEVVRAGTAAEPVTVDAAQGSRDLVT
jgi:hypothetical protein